MRRGRAMESGTPGPAWSSRGDLSSEPTSPNCRFVADDGEVLNAEARFETVAWPDRLALILAVRPGARPSQSRQEPSSRGRSRSRRRPERIPRDQWQAAAMEITLRCERGELNRRMEFSAGDEHSNQQWHEVALAFDPTSFRAESETSPVLVRASEMLVNRVCPVDYDAVRGWHRVDLNGIEPILPSSNVTTGTGGTIRLSESNLSSRIPRTANRLPDCSLQRPLAASNKTLVLPSRESRPCCVTPMGTPPASPSN